MAFVHPKVQKYEILNGGRYYRNLQDEDISLQYVDLPDAGYRLRIGKLRKWNWLDEDGTLALSVNECACCSFQPTRSLELVVQPHKFRHVWEIELELVNQYLQAVDQLVAEYDPTEDSREQNTVQNPCHFVLRSTEGKLTVEEIIAVFEYLENQIPPVGAKHPKKHPKGLSNATEAVSTYQCVVKIHRDCLSL